MSDNDSGVDSGNESNGPAFLNGQNFNGNDVNNNHDNVEIIEANNDSNNNNDDIIDVDSSNSLENSQNSQIPQNNMPGAIPINGGDQFNNGSVMFCQDNQLNEWSSLLDQPTCSKYSNSPSYSNDGLNMRTVSICDMDDIDSNTPSTSSVTARVNVFGVNFPIKQNDLNNLWNFYQNNNSQHNFYPKIKLNRQRRQRIAQNGYYSKNLIAEKQLRTASNSNDIETVRRLINNGVNVKAYDERKRTALHFAACHGYVDIACILLDNGADANQQDVVGNTPLHLAVCSSKLDIVILLLQNGGNCTASDTTGRTPLQLAKSKLALLSRTMESSKSPPEQLKMETLKVSVMLGIYFDKCKNSRKQDIDLFNERISARETKQEIEQDVNDLLQRLEEWSI